MVNESIEFLNATVLDGSGRPPFEANVQVEDGRIRHIGDNPAGADRQIDLEGDFLAPGFVDMHSHSELRLFDRPDATEKITQGITLEVMGQDGVSVAPVPDHLTEEWALRVDSLLGRKDEWEWTSVDDFLTALTAVQPAVNCAYYVPHGNVRSHTAGFEDRQLSDPELEEAQDLLATSIDEGGFAMSKGMIYPPSSYGRDPEFVALGKVLAERNTYLVSHVWNESDYVVESIERFVDVCERAGCQPHISHLKVAGESNWGRSERILDIFEAANERGTTVTFDQYPYTAGSTMLVALLPPWARHGESSDIMRRLRDKEARKRIRDDIQSEEGEWENLARAAGTWDNVLVTRTGSGNYEGETVAEIADTRGTDPVDAVCDVLLEEELDATMVDFVLTETDIERFLADERGTVCTDGIFGGKPHPRAIGTYPRVLERYVRDRDILPVEKAVYKMAGHPTDILGLPDRGRVAEDNVADLVVFDLASVTERATYDDPMRLSRGMQFVLVDGTIVVEASEPTGARPGTVLRSTDVWDGPSRPDA